MNDSVTTNPKVFQIMSSFKEIILSLHMKNAKIDFPIISVILESIEFMTGQSNLYPTLESLKFHLTCSGYTKTSVPITEFYMSLSFILSKDINSLLEVSNVMMLMKCLQEYDPEMTMERQLSYFSDTKEDTVSSQICGECSN